MAASGPERSRRPGGLPPLMTAESTCGALIGCASALMPAAAELARSRTGCPPHQRVDECSKYAECDRYIRQIAGEKRDPSKPQDQEIENRAVEITIDKVTQRTPNYQTNRYRHVRSARAKGADEEYCRNKSGTCEQQQASKLAVWPQETEGYTPVPSKADVRNTGDQGCSIELDGIGQQQTLDRLICHQGSKDCKNRPKPHPQGGHSTRLCNAGSGDRLRLAFGIGGAR